jgi:DNA topoisomerase-3
MNLCLCEKPSVAKSIASFLGSNNKKKGYYEGNGYLVTYTFGHMLSLYEPEDYKENWSRKNTTINDLPIVPDTYNFKPKKESHVRNQLHVLKQLLNSKDVVTIINCGDAGMEGELIQRSLIDFFGASNKPLKRLWVSDFTEPSLKKGFSNLKNGHEYDGLYKAGLTRMIADWDFGINISRALSEKHGFLTYGRVQTPIVYAIIKREMKRSNFSPEPFFNLHTTVSGFELKCNIAPKKDEALGRNYSGWNESEKDELLNILNLSKKSEIVISDFSTKEKIVNSPKQFNLSELLQLMTNKHDWNPDFTDKVLQPIYESGYITYARSTSNEFTLEMIDGVKDTFKAISSNCDLPHYDRFNPDLIDKSPYFKKDIDSDHHAIIPTTKIPSIETYKPGSNERVVYEEIKNRFLTMFLPPAIRKVQEVKAFLEINDKITFTGSKSRLKKEGWQSFYKEIDSKNNQTNDSFTDISFDKGQILDHSPFIKDSVTKKPPSFTYGSLLKWMETCGKESDDEEIRKILKQNGIGTPSSTSGIIKKVITHKYIVEKGKKLTPTKRGIFLVSKITNRKLLDPEFTGKLEGAINKIADGKYEPKQVLDYFGELRTNEINNIKKLPNERAPDSSGAQVVDVGVCPECRQNTMTKIDIQKSSKFSSYYKCQNDECKITISPLPGNKLPTTKQYKAMIEGKKVVIRNIKGKTRNYSAYVSLGEYKGKPSFTTSFQHEKTDFACPVCNSVIERNDLFESYDCSSENCKFRVYKLFDHPKLNFSVRFSESECESFLMGKSIEKEVTIQDKKGKPIKKKINGKLKTVKATYSFRILKGRLKFSK